MSTSSQKSFVKREVLCDCLTNDDWKEISFNSSGTSSIQDIRTQQRTGGINFINHSNRFIFWKTKGNILELVEQSLDVTISGNQLRYKFEDSPVLGDSVSLYETKYNIVLLVATISSVHKIKFPVPKVISTRHEYVNSIFKDVTSDSINQPSTFHIVNTTSTLPYTGTSYLTPEREAIFALALQSGSITIIKINPNTDKAAKVFDIKTDSILRNLNIFSKSRSSQDTSILGMIMKYVDQSLFCLTLSFDGQIKCWSNEMKLVATLNALNYCSTKVLGIQSHLIRKPVNEKDSSFWIYVCLEGDNSCFVQFDVTPDGSIEYRNEAIRFSHFNSSQMNKLTDFIAIQDVLWCVWRTAENESVLTVYNIRAKKWNYSQLELFPPGLNPTSPALCPQRKLSDLIFKPGFFSKSDIYRALNIYNMNFDVDPHLTLRQRVQIAVENEIQSKINKLSRQELDEEYSQNDYIEIAERCWSDFYFSCVQYREMSLLPLGILHITKANLLLVIMSNSFSFLRPLSDVESVLYTNVPLSNNDEYRKFHKFVSSLSALQLDATVNQEISLSLQGAKVFFHMLDELADRSVADIFEDVTEVYNLEKYKESELMDHIEKLLNILNKRTMDDVTPGNQFFNSLVGVNLLTMSMNQIAEVRLRLCCNLIIFLRTVKKAHIKSVFMKFCKEIWELIRNSWIITWLQNESDDKAQSVLLSYVEQTDIRHSDIIKTVTLLLCLDKQNIVRFLSVNNHPLLLQHLSHILDYSSWRYDLMSAYLNTGDSEKAFNVVKEFCDSENLDYYLDVIDIFNKYSCCEYVIRIINVALTDLNLGSDPTSGDKKIAILYSILFDNYLKLKDYAQAFRSILKNTEKEKQIINLHTLILHMFDDRQSKLLLNLVMSEPSEIIPEIIDFCHKRMYTFPIEQSEIYFEFLYSYHIHNAYHFEAAQVKFNQGFCYTKDLQKRCECLVLAVTSLHLVDEVNRRYVHRKKDLNLVRYKLYRGTKIYTELTFERLDISEVKNIYELEKSKGYVKDCPVDADVEEVVCLLTHNGLYKKALQLAYVWKLDLNPIFISLTQHCLLDEIADCNWIFLNDINDYVSTKLDIHTLMWTLLEVLMNKFERRNETYILKCVCEKIISQGYDLPEFLKKKYFKSNPGEVVHLFHKHGCLKAAFDLSIEILNTLMKGNKNNVFSFDKLTPANGELYCGLHFIKFLLHELSKQELYEEEFEILKEKSILFEKYADQTTKEKFCLLKTI